MPHGLTRRDFLRCSAAAAGSLWLASLAEWQPHAAQAAAPRQAVDPAPTFEAIPLPALLGPPADVGIGADGVYWVVDATGAPSTYNPLGQAWQPFGGGIDAAAYIPFVDSNENFSVSLCFFRGSEVYKSGDPGPVPIAQLWPNLPPSFQQGVDGATYLSGNTFYLFRQGQSALVDVWGNVTITLLTAFRGAGWPSGPWQDGMFDYVISGRDDTSASAVLFVRDGQFIVMDLYQGLISSAPQPLTNLFGGTTLALLMQGGIEAVLCSGPVQATGAPLQVFSGPIIYSLPSAQSSAPAQADYLAKAFASWPVSWHPVLAQAPCGSSSALWSVSSDGVPLVNDTTAWTPSPLPDGAAALAVDSGGDGSVYAISTSTFYQLGAGGWTAIGTPGPSLQAVSVGDAAHIWLLDRSGNVYFYGGSGNSLTTVTLGAAAGDIKGSADGTLWHCSTGDANAYRYLSGGSQPSETIPVGLGVTSVQKASASSFGAACFLAQQGDQPALIRYTSPYLFKTDASYTTGFMQRLPVGGASVFVPHISSDQTQITVSALDVQTGAERWRYQYAVDVAAAQNFTEQQGAAPLYDPQHQLLYVFQYAGLVVALDAHTGAVRWSLPLTNQVIPVQPLLAGGALYVPATDDPNLLPNSTTAYLVAIDTNAAANAAAAGAAVQPRWTFSWVVADQPPLSLVPPLLYSGSVYLAAWTNLGGLMNLSAFQIDPAAGAAVPIADITLNQIPTMTPPTVTAVITDIWVGYDPPELLPSLVINAGKAIVGWPLAPSEYLAIYAPQEMAVYPSYTNLVLFDEVIYFADSIGNLYGLDSSFQQVANLPLPVIGADTYAPLTVIPDDQGDAIIILGDTANDNLVLYSAASGNILTLKTNQTAWMSMSDVTGDGLLFGGGQGPDWALGQLFGVRINNLNVLRDFVIESQLVQDYDPGATAVARYQTHITVVDNNKTPQPFTGVKIWCDDPISVLVDEQPFNIGPDTPVSTHVDASGCLTISSDAADIFAGPLRVWAAFMDPFERIVVYPDREFHTRLPAMVADPNSDDPTVINLSTGTNYAGTQVFPDQKQAQDTAEAVTSVCSAAGLGTSTAGVSRAATQPARSPILPTTTCRGCSISRTTRPLYAQPVCKAPMA